MHPLGSPEKEAVQLLEDNLNRSIKRWVDRLSRDHGVPEMQLCQLLAAEEISNRINSYPMVSYQLEQDVVDLDALGNALQDCWALSGRFNAIRLNGFLSHQEQSQRAIRDLVINFPRDDSSATSRIDTFVDTATQFGYRTPQGAADLAGAALLASVLLTSCVPSRFVDFRQTRWKKFISGLRLPVPFDAHHSYGEMLVGCGSFAALITETKEFRKHWGREYSLWVIAGISWTGPDPDLTAITAPDVADPKAFQEGRKHFRLHLARERSQAVVQSAKSKRQIEDPMLHCGVCGFSFVETYGVIGEGFIEAHHIVPLSRISGVIETTIEDLALVCSNCHRMLHGEDDLLTLDDLKGRIQE